MLIDETLSFPHMCSSVLCCCNNMIFIVLGTACFEQYEGGLYSDEQGIFDIG